MPRGGKRPGAGRKPAKRSEDDWIVDKINELVIASGPRRARAQLLRLDPKLAAADGVLREVEAEYLPLPSAERDEIYAAIMDFRQGNPDAINRLQEPLKRIAEDLDYASNDHWKELRAECWVKRGGRHVPPLSSSEWSRVYGEVAGLASEHFKRRITQRSVKEAVARSKMRWRQDQS